MNLKVIRIRVVGLADLADCASFSMAPVDTKSVKCLDALYDYASSFADAHADDFAIRANIHVPAEVPRSPFMIAKLEELHKVCLRRQCTILLQRLVSRITAFPSLMECIACVVGG